MSIKISKSVFSNTVWAIGGRFGYLIIGLISNIVLARLIDPEFFGLMAIISFFLIIGNILVESGFSGALIRKNNITDDDYSTVFICNLIISLIVVIFLYSSSGLVSNYYKNEDLNILIKMSTLILVFNALGVVQIAKLVKEMRFKAKALCEFTSIIFGSIVAIIFALYELKLWALIALPLVSSLVLTTLLWIVVGPIKSYRFSYKSFTEFYSFGVNTTLASLLTTFTDGIYNLIIAKNFSLITSGNFYQAKKLQEVPVGIIQSSFMNVIYSHFSKYLDNLDLLILEYKKIYKYYLVINFLIFSLIFLLSEKIVLFVLGEKWFEAIAILRILAVSGFLYILEMYFRLLFKLYNKTDKILKIEIFKRSAQLIFLGVFISDIHNLILSIVFTNLIGLVSTFYIANKMESNISFEYCYDFFRLILIATVFYILYIYCVGYVIFENRSLI